MPKNIDTKEYEMPKYIDQKMAIDPLFLGRLSKTF